MLKLVQIELLKLRRRKMVWLMMVLSLFMPIMVIPYIKVLRVENVEPALFFRWSALGFNLAFLLPIVLGMLSTMMMYNENQNDMLKQFWIVPVSRVQYFFSKFFVVLLYSLCFMLITAIATIISAKLSGCVLLTMGSILFLLQKSLEVGFLSAFAMLPIFAIAASQKGYILPACITLVYVFAYFILSGINMYIHPLCSMSVIIVRNHDVPDLNFSQAINIPAALLCILIWDAVSVLFAIIILKRR